MKSLLGGIHGSPNHRAEAKVLVVRGVDHVHHRASHVGPMQGVLTTESCKEDIVWCKGLIAPGLVGIDGPRQESEVSTTNRAPRIEEGGIVLFTVLVAGDMTPAGQKLVPTEEGGIDCTTAHSINFVFCEEMFQICDELVPSVGMGEVYEAPICRGAVAVVPGNQQGLAIL